MSVLIKQMIPVDDTFDVIKKPRRIEVIAEQPVIFKIPCYKKPSPCKIDFKYLLEGKR